MRVKRGKTKRYSINYELIYGKKRKRVRRNKMEELKCIQCGKVLIKGTQIGDHWCDMKCKEEFYKKYYMGSGLVKMIDDAEKQKMEEYKKSKEYKDFMIRVDEVGFCKALWELKD